MATLQRTVRQWGVHPASERPKLMTLIRPLIRLHLQVLKIPLPRRQISRGMLRIMSQSIDSRLHATIGAGNGFLCVTPLLRFNTEGSTWINVSSDTTGIIISLIGSGGGIVLRTHQEASTAELCRHEGLVHTTLPCDSDRRRRKSAFESLRWPDTRSNSIRHHDT